ncbi:hypothetical protein KR222_008063 [Zaprionus bogoriensis]|nr:hypothetical protein KR222_008063 [Zaprionus bogoriensis]
MFKFVLIASLLASVALAAPLTREEQDEQLELERVQNESAKYFFNSKVNDEINDSGIEREETRDGSKVTGFYAYNDGYIRRKVYYEADQNGYRVVKEDKQEIGDGPQFNPDGIANVNSSLGTNYSIKLDKADDEKHYKDAGIP